MKPCARDDALHAMRTSRFVAFGPRRYDVTWCGRCGHVEAMVLVDATKPRLHLVRVIAIGGLR